MAIFSGKVVSAKFIDPPNNMMVELLYHEGDVVVPYILEVDFTQQDFNDLLKEISLDDIQENTRKEVNAQFRAFSEIINAEVDRRWKLESEKIKEAYDKVDEYANKRIKEAFNEADEYAEIEKSKKLGEVQEEFKNLRNDLSARFTIESSSNKLTPKELFHQLFSMDQDQDFVFNFKISILEDPDIAKSKDKDLKLSIRKAKTVTELLKIYCSNKVA
jgi:hypothetical protein